MSRLRAVAVGLLLLLYLRSPIDLLPDRIGAYGLIDDLIVLLVGIWWIRRQLRQDGTAQAHNGGEPRHVPRGASQRTPYEILGVPFSASRDEITHAYRERMKEYHPDRVAGLGEELQRLAHDKTIEIQRAYAELTRVG